MFKNTAAKFMVFAWDTTTGVAKTGDAANLTAYVSKDYGSVTVLADTAATEMDATNAKGYYLFDAAQGETNGDVLMVSAKSATANIAVIGAPAVIYTRPTTNWLAPATLNRTLVVDANGLADANTVKVGPTGSGTAQTARDIGASVIAASISNGGIAAASFAAGAIDAAALAVDAGTEIGTAVWATATRVLTASTNLGDLDDAVLAVLGTPAGVSLAADVAAVNAKTTNLPTDPADASVIAGRFDTLDTSVGDLPTNAELATALAAADDAVLAAIAAVQADLPQRITKNVALAAFPFKMVLSTDHITPATGMTVTATRMIDGAAFGACANAVSEVSAGWYKIDLAAADLNGNTIGLKFTAPGADQVDMTIVTEPT